MKCSQTKLHARFWVIAVIEPSAYGLTPDIGQHCLELLYLVAYNDVIVAVPDIPISLH